ncbi:hypothetical protein V1511DRAFT_459368 [Dipodascopsis uninucleata]
MSFLKRLKYRYEVTMPLYVMTPTEAFIFNSFTLICLALLILTMCTYLPKSMQMFMSRTYYYYSGVETMLESSSRLSPSPAGRIANQLI